MGIGYRNVLPWDHALAVYFRHQALVGLYRTTTSQKHSMCDITSTNTHCHGRFVRWGDTSSQLSVSGLYLR